jgi:hypothetical protein
MCGGIRPLVPAAFVADRHLENPLELLFFATTHCIVDIGWRRFLGCFELVVYKAA